MYSNIVRSVRGAFAAAAALALVAATPAFAQNITYTFTGVGSGSLNSVNFTNQSFSFVMSTPTAAVSIPSGFPDVWSADALTASFTLGGGFGSGTISNVYAFNNQSTTLVGFGTIPEYDLLMLNVPGLGTYGMVTSYGPQTATSSNVYFYDAPRATSAGALQITAVSTATFEASVDSNVVPEPSTYVLMSAGLLAIAAAARRRRVSA
jgi:hypothetical protein